MLNVKCYTHLNSIFLCWFCGDYLIKNLFIITILGRIQENGKHIECSTSYSVSLSAFHSISIAVSILELKFNILTN